MPQNNNRKDNRALKDRQDYLRKEVKLAKACNDDITYKDFAEYLDISYNSFTNWLYRQYKLTTTNEHKLHNLVKDMIDIE